MASQLPCVKNDAGGYTFYVSLVSQANTKIMQASPTLAAGDVKIAIDDGAPANLGTLPAVDADFTKRVKVVLSQAETNGDNLTIIFSDAAGDEWCDLTVNIQTAAQTFDTTDGVADAILTDTGTTLDGKADQLVAACITNAAGVDIAADIIAVKAETAAILTDTGTTLDGKIDTIAVDVAGLDGAAMRGTDSAALAAVCTEARLAELDAANVPADIAAVKGDTAAILTDTAVIGAAGAGLTAVPWNATWDAEVQSEATDALNAYDPPTKAEMDTAHALLATPAQVNAEVVDALATDTYAEPGQGAPAATASLSTKIGHIYKAWRNKKRTTSSQISIYNDAGDTVDQKATISDDGTNFDQAEIGTGP